ncbi:MAG: glycine zipper domain-containing protein [Pseudolabrys sp.]
MSGSFRLPYKSFVIALSAILLSPSALPIPAHAQMGPKETQGTIGGALIGGIVGGLVGGRGSGAVVGAIAGTAIGGLIGNRIGASLDAQDRAALARATRAAFTSGKSQHFSRKSGTRGRVDVTSSSRVDGKPCRTVRQEVVLKDGSVLTDTVSACRGPNGWQV